MLPSTPGVPGRLPALRTRPRSLQRQGRVPHSRTELASFNEICEGTVFYQGVRDFGVRCPSNRVWTNAFVRLAGPGDTLLSVRAPVGRVNLATEETCIGRGVASVRSSSGRPFTLFHLLKDSHEAWAPFEAEGTVFGSINKIQLASLPVPSIRAEQEERLEGQLAPIERTIASALAENANLAATRDALLPSSCPAGFG